MKVLLVFPLFTLFYLIKSNDFLQLEPYEQMELENYAWDVAMLIFHIQHKDVVLQNKLEHLVFPTVYNMIKGIPLKNNITDEEKEEREKFNEILYLHQTEIRQMNFTIHNFYAFLIDDKKIRKEDEKKYFNIYFKKIKKLIKEDIKANQYKSGIENTSDDKDPTALRRMKVGISSKKFISNILDYPLEDNTSYKRKFPIIFSLIMSVSPTNKNILKTLRSIQYQDFEKLEIIFIVRQNETMLIEKLKKEMEKDKRIKVIRVRVDPFNVISRMITVRKAKGKYILFLEENYMLIRRTLNDLFLEIRRSGADFLHFRTFYGNLQDLYCYEDKEKIKEVNRTIIQPELENYFSKNYNTYFLGDKVFLRKYLLNDERFFEIKGMDYEKFINFYSDNAKKYFSSTKFLLYKIPEDKEHVDLKDPTLLKVLEMI